MLYLPKCGPYDGGIKLLNLFWHVWEMADFGGKTVKFPKMPWLWQPMHQTKGEILEILHLTIHKTQFNAQSRANGEISQNAMTLIANCYY